MTKEQLQEHSMMIIAYAGTAKSNIQEAINLADEGEFKNAKKLLEEAEKSLVDANKEHFKVLQADAKGLNFRLDVLFIHAEDQFLTTQQFKTTAEAIIKLHKKIATNKG